MKFRRILIRKGKLKLGRIHKYIVILYVVVVAIFLSLNFPIFAQQIRAELEPGIYAVCYPSYKIFIECYSNSAKNLNKWLASNLQNPADAKVYQKTNSFVIPLYKFKTSLYSQVFTKLFEKDNITKEGWIHIVPRGYSLNRDGLSFISTALTGRPENADKIISCSYNKSKTLPLKENEKIIIPTQLLLKELRTKTYHAENKFPVLVPIDPKEDCVTQVPPDNTLPSSSSITQQKQIKVHHPELKYGKDAKGEYVTYKIKKGELIYRDVIPRFTFCKTEKEKVFVSKEIMKRSGLTSERQIKQGTIVKIPISYIKPELVSGISHPSVNKLAEESEKKSKGREELKNIVVILDPGHGGRDVGASQKIKHVFEDELNYDIAIRVMKYLQEHTSARVYLTLRDNSRGFEVYNGSRFEIDEDEVILVTPPYKPREKDGSANLRWILANSIMRRNEAIGIPKENMVFISIHFDSLPPSYRGTRVFVPSSSHRKEIEYPKSNIIKFESFAEWRDNKPRILNASEKIKDKECSHRFAHIFISNLKKNNIVIYNMGDPIQEIINRSPKSTYVPAVLRNTEIPTKVLIESANLKNDKDLSNVTNPEWRQKFAEALAKSIIAYFSK